MVRVATAGSVDDGKSTLIGRLLYDTKSLFSDQLDAVERASRRLGATYVNLALVTDGLRAEREQGITIDVAYRYFATPRRSFILADTPGHVQYTRNMVTGASTADVALVLVDVRNGVVTQSRRHAFLASLLRVPHLVVCVNKMDLVDFDRDAFDAVVDDFTEFSRKLDVTDVTFIPTSALHGDNITERSPRMPWYGGASLLHHLDHVHVASDRNLVDARFPVQLVLRPYDDAFHDYRGLAGTVASGTFRVGDEVVALPSGFATVVEAIDCFDGPLQEATAGDAVTIRLRDDLDVSRGDLLCRPHNRPQVGQELDAMVCWMSDHATLGAGQRLWLKHTTRWVQAMVGEVRYRLDIDSLRREPDIDRLALNDIGRLTLRTNQPLLYDAYRRNRATGSFILVDEGTCATVAAGMILGATGQGD